MRDLNFLFWLGFIILHQYIDAFSITFSIRPVPYTIPYSQHTKTPSSGFQQEHRAGLRRSRLLGRVPSKQETFAPKAPVTNPVKQPGPNNKGRIIPLMTRKTRATDLSHKRLLPKYLRVRQTRNIFWGKVVTRSREI